MRALVTGALGFVGRHLVDHLEASGDDPIASGRATGGADLLDPDGLRRELRDASPDVIYHLAGLSDVGGSWEHAAMTLRVNAEGTQNLLSAARDTGVARVLCVSSAAVYGAADSGGAPLTETSPIRPVSPYAASKAAAEQVVTQADLGYGQDVVCVRPFNHLGPGQSTAFVAAALADRIARAERDGSSTITVGNLDAQRDFTDVRDVVRAYRMLMTEGRRGEVYNVASGQPVAIKALAEQLLVHAHRRLELVFDTDLSRSRDVSVLWGDAHKLRAATGWEPTIPLEKTLEDLLIATRHRMAPDHDKKAGPQ